MYVANIAALKIVPNPTTAQEFTLAGYANVGDGGGGTFIWITSASLPPENFGIIVYSSIPLYASAGYFQRIYSGPINVRWFGATGDGTTDDSAAGQAALNAAIAKSATVYFPTGTYIGSWNIYDYKGRGTSIIGDGFGTVLQTKNNTTAAILTLGYAGDNSGDWLPKKISKITLDGTNPVTKIAKYTNGVEFMNLDGAGQPAYTQGSGRWAFEDMCFNNCVKAVYKPSGNIGNIFINCYWSKNDFGYYAEGYFYQPPWTPPAPKPDPLVMHPGNDKFIGGHIAGSTYAGIFINYTIPEGFGQIIVDGTVIEYNPGFGIFIKINQNNERMLAGAIELRNIWMENNSSSGSVTINGVTYSNVCDYAFEEVRGVMITGGRLRKLSAKASTILLTNCRTDESQISVDAGSLVTADQLRFIGAPSQQIFVNSIAYDGASDIKGWTNVGGGVWGPLRSITQTGNDNILCSQNYDISTWTFTKQGSPGVTYNTSLVVAGVLKNRCAKLSILATGGVINYYSDLTNKAILNDNSPKYYVWSIHAYTCGGSIVGKIGTLPSSPTSIEFGNVILKRGWTCSYGIRLLTGNSLTPPEIHLQFGTSSATLVSVVFADFQILKFDTFSEASGYLNSRAFATGGSVC